MKYATLSWVKPAIDDTLKLTRQSLEQFVENPDDTGPLQEAAGWLHEIHGALTMLEIDSAVLLLKEMEHVTQALLANKIPDKGAAYDSLMRGVLQLPNYLDHLTLGYPQVPMALLPLINKLRVLIREKPLPAATLFFPDVSLSNPHAKPIPKIPEAQFKVLIQKVRISYQKGLVEFVQGANKMDGLKLMLNTLNQAQQVTGTAQVSKVWWISEALLESIAQKGLNLNENLIGMFKQIDGLLKPLMEQGMGALTVAPPAKFVSNLLFYAAQGKSTGQRLKAVKETFQLDYCLPSELALQNIIQIFSGPDIELMRIAVMTMRDDFSRLEETLDIFMRTEHPELSDLKPLVELMRNAGFTLRLLGLEKQAQALLKQSQVIDAIVEGKIEPSLPRMLDIANVILRVEAAMETLSKRGTHAISQIQQEQGLLETQFKEVVKVLVEEAKIELTEMIQPFISYLETKTPDDELHKIPERFQNLGGVFLILNQPRAAKLTQVSAHYVANKILLDNRVPDNQQRKLFADLIVSFELFLDSLAGHPLDGIRILQSAQSSLHALLPSHSSW
jgi:chemosensory pili system protein ChpA (sensor histidine kinase/response regulator)